MTRCPVFRRSCTRHRSHPPAILVGLWAVSSKRSARSNREPGQQWLAVPVFPGSAIRPCSRRNQVLPSIMSGVSRAGHALAAAVLVGAASASGRTASVATQRVATSCSSPCRATIRSSRISMRGSTSLVLMRWLLNGSFSAPMTQCICGSATHSARTVSSALPLRCALNQARTVAWAECVTARSDVLGCLWLPQRHVAARRPVLPGLRTCSSTTAPRRPARLECAATWQR